MPTQDLDFGKPGIEVISAQTYPLPNNGIQEGETVWGLNHGNKKVLKSKVLRYRKARYLIQIIHKILVIASAWVAFQSIAMCHFLANPQGGVTPQSILYRVFPRHLDLDPIFLRARLLTLIFSHAVFFTGSRYIKPLISVACIAATLRSPSPNLARIIHEIA